MYKRFLLITIMVLSVFACAKKEKYELSLTPKAGEVITSYMNTNMNLDQEMMGQKLQMDISMLMAIEEKIISVTDGVIESETKFVDFDMKMTGMEDLLGEEGSEEVMKGLIDEMLAKISDISFTLKYDSKGTIIEVINFDSIVNALGQATTPAEQGLYESFNEDEIIKSLEKRNAIYPDSAVAVGDTWEKEDSMEIPVPVTVKTKYTLKKVTDDKFIVKLVQDAKIKQNDDSSEMAMTLEGTVKGSGTMEISRANGYTVGGNIKVDADVASSFDMGNGEKMEMPMAIKMEMTYSDKPAE